MPKTQGYCRTIFLLVGCGLSGVGQATIGAQLALPTPSECFRSARTPLSTARPHSVDFFHQIYFPQLGYFCKLDWRHDKKWKTPVRFRLGEVNYVDYLEGKCKVLR